MNDNNGTHLEMRWVPVVDDAGRTRMEAVWITTGQTAVGAHAA
jgi:hypothetical protein